MEPMLAALAAERRADDPELMAELQAAAGATAIDDDASYLKSSGDFHRLVARLSGNSILYLFSHSLEDILHDRVTGMLFGVDQRSEVVEAHRAVAQAIVKGQPTKARQLMHAHMERYAHFLAERFPALMDEIVDWR
jgi:GntR family transcriptional regulator, transcriptional repressor for pyruvate dehydrogenase complex